MCVVVYVACDQLFLSVFVEGMQPMARYLTVCVVVYVASDQLFLSVSVAVSEANGPIFNSVCGGVCGK